MKRFLNLVFLFLLLQLNHAQKPTFLRLYDSHGKKINRGELFETTDTSLVLTRKNIFTETPVTKINVIKSKRTTSHRILITALKIAGAAIFLVATVYNLSRPGYSYSTIDNNNKSKSQSPKKIMRTPKAEKKYEINQDAEKWKKQRALLNGLS
jgi:hypothetical protein